VRKPVKTDKAPVPIGPYSQAIIEGDLIYVSGQGPVDPRTREKVAGDVRAQTSQTLANIQAILEAAGSSLDKVVRCNVYLTNMKDFAAMNEIYTRAFTAPFPARTTIAAAALPGDIEVEIDCIARR
jgi:2-iminobutanoate/2-iminopropanoate deaminase